MGQEWDTEQDAVHVPAVFSSMEKWMGSGSPATATTFMVDHLEYEQNFLAISNEVKWLD